MSALYYRKALFRSRKAISCANVMSVDGFSISGRQPEDTDRRVVFSFSDASDSPVYYKLNISDGVASIEEVATQEITGESVIAEGNSVTELSTVTSIPDFVGKDVYVVIALAAPEEATTVPTLGIGIVMTSGGDIYEKVEESAVYELSSDEDVSIISVSASTETTGSGTVSLEIRFKTGSTWGDYMTLAEANASTIYARAFQFRATYTVEALDGSDSATVKSVYVAHRAGNVGNLTEGTAVMVTQTYNFINTMTRAHLMVKHPIVADTSISAQISLRSAPSTVTGELLATGTGEQKTVTLANTTDLASHGFVLYFDGVKQDSSTYSYSPSDGQVTFTAASGVAVTADYIYNWEDEVYVDFTHDTTYPDKEDSNLVDDQFDYAAYNETDPTGSVGAVRLLLEQLTGTETNVVLGTGTGKTQAFQLAHHAKLESVKVTPETASWYLDEDNDTLKVIANAGETISVTYDWVGRPVSVDSIVCIFDE